MDPNTNLQEQEQILQRRRREAHLPRNYAAVKLGTLRNDLWDWLRRGGFEPKWDDCPLAAIHFRRFRGAR